MSKTHELVKVTNSRFCFSWNLDPTFTIYYIHSYNANRRLVRSAFEKIKKENLSKELEFDGFGIWRELNFATHLIGRKWNGIEFLFRPNPVNQRIVVFILKWRENYLIPEHEGYSYKGKKTYLCKQVTSLPIYAEPCFQFATNLCIIIWLHRQI